MTWPEAFVKVALIGGITLFAIVFIVLAWMWWTDR